MFVSIQPLSSLLSLWASPLTLGGTKSPWHIANRFIFIPVYKNDHLIQIRRNPQLGLWMTEYRKNRFPQMTTSASGTEICWVRLFLRELSSISADVRASSNMACGSSCCHLFIVWAIWGGRDLLSLVMKAESGGRHSVKPCSNLARPVRALTRRPDGCKNPQTELPTLSAASL